MLIENSRSKCRVLVIQGGKKIRLAFWEWSPPLVTHSISNQLPIEQEKTCETYTRTN